MCVTELRLKRARRMWLVMTNQTATVTSSTSTQDSPRYFSFFHRNLRLKEQQGQQSLSNRWTRPVYIIGIDVTVPWSVCLSRSCIVCVPSVLWYCWLGLLTCKNRLPYNLYCVGGNVKHCSIHPSIVHCAETAEDIDTIFSSTTDSRLFKIVLKFGLHRSTLSWTNFAPKWPTPVDLSVGDFWLEIVQWSQRTKNYRPFEWYHRWPPTTSPSHNMGSQMHPHLDRLRDACCHLANIIEVSFAYDIPIERCLAKLLGPWFILLSTFVACLLTVASTDPHKK